MKRLFKITKFISFLIQYQLLFYFANLGIGLFHHGHPPGTKTFDKVKFYNQTDNCDSQNGENADTESLKKEGDYVRYLRINL